MRSESVKSAIYQNNFHIGWIEMILDGIYGMGIPSPEFRSRSMAIKSKGGLLAAFAIAVVDLSFFVPW